MAGVYITEADGASRGYALSPAAGEEFWIGRDAACQASYPGHEVLSSQHARIYLTEQGYVLADNGSCNGIQCGDRPVDVEVLQEGVVYTLGDLSLVYDASLQAQAENAPAGEDSPLPAAPVDASQLEAALAAQDVAAPKLKRQAVAPERRLVRSAAAGMQPVMYQGGKKGANPYPILIPLAILVGLYAGLVLRHWKTTGEVVLNLFGLM